MRVSDVDKQRFAVEGVARLDTTEPKGHVGCPADVGVGGCIEATVENGDCTRLLGEVLWTVMSDIECAVPEHGSIAIGGVERTGTVEVEVAVGVGCIAVKGVVGTLEMATGVGASVGIDDRTEVQAADETAVRGCQSPSTHEGELRLRYGVALLSP